MTAGTVRVPPHSLEAEQSLLGALLLDNRAFERVADLVAADDFYRDDHRRIFRAIAGVIDAGKPADVVTLSDEIETGADKGRTGGAAYLASLAQNTPGAANARRYAEIIRDRALLRMVATVGAELQESALSGGRIEAAEILAAAEGKLLAFSSRGARDASSLDVLLSRVVEKVDQAYHRNGELAGLPTGFSDLDRLLGGLEPGHLVILAGRPSMGKTALAMNIAEHVAERVGPVAIFSMEMSEIELGQRILSGRARVPMADLRLGRIEDAGWGRVTGAISELHGLPIVVDDSAAVTCAHVRARARRVQRERDSLALVVVDYLQLMRGQGDTREQEVSSLSRGLKAVAKELGVPVLCLAQLNRAVTQRVDRRPMLSDLRESGAIEQDADVILFIHREEIFDPDTWQRGVAQVLVRKQRNGPTGDVWLTYLGPLMRFENCAEPPSRPADVPPRRVSGFRPPSTDARMRAAGDRQEAA